MESFGIKTGNFIRIPLRGNEKYFPGLTVVVTNYEQELLCNAVITEVWNHEFHDDLKLASYNKDGFPLNDGQVLMMYADADPKFN